MRLEVKKRLSVGKRLTVSSRILCSGSIMFRYMWADTANNCPFHSCHHDLYDSVMKMVGTQLDRSISVVSASGGS